MLRARVEVKVKYKDDGGEEREVRLLARRGATSPMTLAEALKRELDIKNPKVLSIAETTEVTLIEL